MYLVQGTRGTRVQGTPVPGTLYWGTRVPMYQVLPATGVPLYTNQIKYPGTYTRYLVTYVLVPWTRVPGSTVPGTRYLGTRIPMYLVPSTVVPGYMYQTGYLGACTWYQGTHVPGTL